MFNDKKKATVSFEVGTFFEPGNCALCKLNNVEFSEMDGHCTVTDNCILGFEPYECPIEVEGSVTNE